MEVDFVTLGDASEQLNVPSPTLRNWTDQLEEMNVHFVKRNNRNERIYYDSDLEIFAFIRDLKQEYGRKTTMKDIASMILDMADRFELRSEEDAPVPKPSNKTADLINADDVQRLMENQRVRALVSYMIDESTKRIHKELQYQWEKERELLKESLREEIRREIQQEHKQIAENLTSFEERQKKRDEEYIEILKKRDRESMKLLQELLEQRKKEYEERKERESKGFFAKLFGK